MVLTENNPSVNTCSCMCTALRVHLHIFTICCIQYLSKMLKIYFGKRLLHAYEHLRFKNYDPVMMCEVPFVHGFIVEFLDFHAILNLLIFYKKVLQACGERGFLQVPYLLQLEKDNSWPRGENIRLPSSSPRCSAIVTEGEEPSNGDRSRLQQPGGALLSTGAKGRAGTLHCKYQGNTTTK